MKNPTPWRLEPIGSLTTGEECTGMCVVDANGAMVDAIHSSRRPSTFWGKDRPHWLDEEKVLKRIVYAMNATEAKQ